MQEVFQSINSIFAFIGPLSDFLWDFPTNFEWYANIPLLGNFSFAIILLLGSGILFSFRLGFVQVRGFRKGIGIMTEKRTITTGISPLGAFLLSSAMRVGPGNILGVTGAIAVGGPGALFWMWISAFFGMAVAYMEAVLAQIFKEQKDDEFVGGLPFYGRKLLGNSGLTMGDLLMKDEHGRRLPTPDSLAPLDVTHPAWEEHIRLHLKHIIDMGFDYLKIDFLAHAAMEGVHYDSSYQTGRQALVHGYEVIVDELSKADRPIFLSLSIAPLFPHGYGHARRQCCDSFGHSDDVRYVLNAVNFAWWTNRKLYHFNDPDHITLYQSLVDGRSVTLEEEARSRYNSAVISGTVMLLSDNYGPHTDEETTKATHARAARIADNDRLNAIAREGHSFRPVELKDGTAQVYTCKNNGKLRAAFFNYSDKPATVSMAATRAGWPMNGSVTDINRNITWQYDTVLSVALAPFDSAVLEWN